MGITGGFDTALGTAIDFEHGSLSRNVQFTHKSLGHWADEEDGAASWVSDGVVCGERNARFSSADWMAVDCPCCLSLK